MITTAAATPSRPHAAGTPLNRANPAAAGTSAPETASAASTTSNASTGLTAASHQRQPIRQRSKLPPSSRRARGPASAVHPTAANDGPSKAGRWVGQPRPSTTVAPRVARGITHAQLSAYASTTNRTGRAGRGGAVSGTRVSRPVSTSTGDPVPTDGVVIPAHPLPA